MSHPYQNQIAPTASTPARWRRLSLAETVASDRRRGYLRCASLKRRKVSGQIFHLRIAQRGGDPVHYRIGAAARFEVL